MSVLQAGQFIFLLILNIFNISRLYIVFLKGFHFNFFQIGDRLSQLCLQPVGDLCIVKTTRYFVLFVTYLLDMHCLRCRCSSCRSLPCIWLLDDKDVCTGLGRWTNYHCHIYIVYSDIGNIMSITWIIKAAISVIILSVLFHNCLQCCGHR